MGSEIVEFLFVHVQNTDKFTDAQFDRYNLDRHIYSCIYVRTCRDFTE